MKKIKVGGQIEASAVALGCMRMNGMDVSQAEKHVCLAMDLGIDFFDHADIYGAGGSEQIFGEVLRRNPGLREKMWIQSKCGIYNQTLYGKVEFGSGAFYDASKEHILRAAEGSLKRLGIDCLDVLLLHRPDALMEPEEVAEAVTRLQAQGKIRYFGVSNENAGQMALLQKYLKQNLLVNQLQYGPAHTILVDEGVNVNIHSAHASQLGGGVLDYCRYNDVTVQAWSPFQHGMFEGPYQTSEKYEALNAAMRKWAERKGVSETAAATAWVLRHPANIQMIAGTMNEARLRDVCEGADLAMTRPEWYEIYLAAGNPLP